MARSSYGSSPCSASSSSSISLQVLQAYAAILPFLFIFLLLYVGYLVYESWEKLAIIVESKNTNQTII